VAFNVQGFRVAVNKGTGEIKILKSVHAADAGRVANQCSAWTGRGRVAQSLGATLYEEMVIDNDGRVVNPNSRLPPAVICGHSRTEVLFADTTDTLGRWRQIDERKSLQSVAAALGNALADATGIRLRRCRSSRTDYGRCCMRNLLNARAPDTAQRASGVLQSRAHEMSVQVGPALRRSVKNAAPRPDT